MSEADANFVRLDIYQTAFHNFIFRQAIIILKFSRIKILNKQTAHILRANIFPKNLSEFDTNYAERKIANV